MDLSTYRRSPAFGVLLLAISASAGCTNAMDDGVDATESAVAELCRPPIPTVIQVPAGHRLAFSYDAVGLQLYRCDALTTGYGWVFVAPDAKLYGRNGKQTGTHYAGPTWESNDGSTIVGAKVADYVADANAIPWLLLSAKSHAGTGRMTPVTFIQRLETTGGKAPASGCDATHVGEAIGVEYTANYVFYEAR